MRFVVIGAGAIGGVVGARLVESGHNVVFVARGAHGEAISRNGLTVASPAGTVTLTVNSADDVRDVEFHPDDIVLLSVKSQDTVVVLDDLLAHAPGSLPIVCLQNGVHNESEALRRFPNVYGTTVMCPTVHLQPGRVVAHSAPTTGIIDVGRYPTGIDDLTNTVTAALASSTFSSLPQSQIARWKWRKLISNLGNAIEAVCGPQARRGPVGDLVRAEGEAVLEAAGIEYMSAADDAERRADHLRLQPVDGAPRPGGSTWQSLARATGRVETDYLNGEIVRLGRIHGVDTPANTALQEHARAMAKSGADPGAVDPEDFLEALGSTVSQKP